LTRFAVTLSFAVALATAVATAQQSPGDYIVYVGSYTNTTAKGIYAWWFDPRRGKLSEIGLVAEATYPAQVFGTPDGRFLYAANWQGTETAPGDTITAYAVDRRTGRLTFLNLVKCGGSGPNQVIVDPSGKVAVAVNYRSGSVAAFGIEPDGRLTDAFYIDQHTGEPTPPSRQPGPRAHGVVFSKDSKSAYVADIGLDRVYSYRLDVVKRTMTPLDPPYVTQTAGSGPRRLQLHPNGRLLYLARETDSSVSVFEVDNGRLKEIQNISTLPAPQRGNTTAEILIDKAGKFLYVSNRGHDTIAVFAIASDAGTLTLVEHAPAGGRIPRNFSIDPTGDYLFTSNQNGENVVVLRIDRTTGRLTPTGEEVKLANPGSIFFVKAR
jgi:6-phosphogluconolactonase